MANSIFIDTLNGIKSERPPVWFMRQAGRVLPSYKKLCETYTFRELMQSPELTAEVTLLPVNDLGVDAAILFSDILVVPEALGMKVNFTGKGPKFETPLSDSSNPSSVLKPDTSSLIHIYSALDLIKSKKPDDVALIGFCGSPFTTYCYMVEGNSTNHTFNKAIELLYNDRKKAETILEIITDVSIEYAVNQCRHGIDVFQIFDTHAGLIPSDLYIEMILPFIKKLTLQVRNQNIPVIFFPKGIGLAQSKITHEYTDFIGIDWQTSIFDARKDIERNIGLQGNLDPRILSTTNKKLLINELEKFRKFGQKELNWIFNTGHGLSPDNSFDNVKFVVEWIKDIDWRR